MLHVRWELRPPLLAGAAQADTGTPAPNFIATMAALDPAPACSAARYGQLAPVVAPIYYAYGDALLRVVEANSANAFAGGGGDDDSDDDEDEAAAAGGAGAVAPSASARLSAARAGAYESKSGAQEGDDDEGDEEEEGGVGAEEEGEDVAADGDGDDDIAIAWECLECARTIYSKQTGQVRARRPLSRSVCSDPVYGGCCCGVGSPAPRSIADALRSKPRALSPAVS
jgi:hypothetical protein